jgi:hypothetical protein
MAIFSPLKWPNIVPICNGRHPQETWAFLQNGEAIVDMSKDGPMNIDGAEEAKKMIKRRPVEISDHRSVDWSADFCPVFFTSFMGMTY